MRRGGDGEIRIKIKIMRLVPWRDPLCKCRAAEKQKEWSRDTGGYKQAAPTGFQAIGAGHKGAADGDLHKFPSKKPSEDVGNDKLSVQFGLSFDPAPV